MYLQQIGLVALFAITSLVTCQTPAPTQSVAPSQSSAFRDVLSSYSSSFKASPQYSGIAQNLFLDLPSSVLSSVQASPGSLIPVPTGSAFNLHSFATNPPTTFPQLDWESYLSKHPQVSTSIDGLRTSAVLALATSAQSIIGTSVSIAAPPTSSSTGGAAPAPTIPTFASGAMGAAAGLIGAAAVLL